MRYFEPIKLAAMDTSTDGYAIFANATLQYVSTADTRDEAYGDYAREVGFDRSTYPMTSDDVSFHYVPATDMEKWEDADSSDHPVVNHPV